MKAEINSMDEYIQAFPQEIQQVLEKRFATKLSQYNKGRGSLQFPLDKPMPYDLIANIVEFRVQENLLKSIKG